jgi:DHA1 family multidrug resistance protein-like MFS transporter
MADIIRDAWLGQIIRLLSKNRWLKYPEEEEGFTWPPYVSSNSPF